MNFIKQLQAEFEESEQNAENTRQQIELFKAHLNSPKFQGVENGESKDWISTGDVLNWLEGIRRSLNGI